MRYINLHLHYITLHYILLIKTKGSGEMRVSGDFDNINSFDHADQHGLVRRFQIELLHGSLQSNN